MPSLPVAVASAHAPSSWNRPDVLSARAATAVSGSLAVPQGSTGLITRRMWLQIQRSLMLNIEIGQLIMTITVLPPNAIVGR